jgi:hypothetical protein
VARTKILTKNVFVYSQAIASQHLPPADAAADRPSLWPLGHGGMVDLGPRRWEGSAPCFEGSLICFYGQGL